MTNYDYTKEFEAYIKVIESYREKKLYTLASLKTNFAKMEILDTKNTTPEEKDQL